MSHFELTNNQRLHLGLRPVAIHWDRILFPKGLVCFFEQDMIRKAIISVQDLTELYTEIDLDIQTATRTQILSKTGKGKAKTITANTIFDYSPRVACLRVTISTLENEKPFTIYSTIGKRELDFTHNAPALQESRSLEAFGTALDRFIATLPESHLPTVALLQNLPDIKTKPVRFKSGDFFAVPVRYDLYGNPVHYTFGRHLLNIAALRKQKGLLPQLHQWNSLMTIVQLVTLYDWDSGTLDPDFLALSQTRTIPAFHMMDNRLMRGEYPIIGHLPLAPEALNFPMHLFAHKGTVSFGWGICYIENINFQPQSPPAPTLENNGVNSAAEIRVLEKLRAGASVYDAYWDLQHPENTELMAGVFAAMGVSPTMTYDDFCHAFGYPDRKALLEMTKHLN